MPLVILIILSLLLVSIVSISIDSLCIDKEAEAMKDYCKVECKDYKKLV